MIKIKRVYEEPAISDGTRYLVERLWPRGFKKESLEMKAWIKAVAPSDELRQWFGHDPLKWDEFLRRYWGELETNPTAWQPLAAAAKLGEVTLLYSAHDTEHNNALALKLFLESHLETAE